MSFCNLLQCSMSQRFLNFYIIASKKECFPDIFRGFSLFCTPPSMSYGPEGVDLYMILSKKECLPDLFRGISLFCNLLQCSMSQRLITFLYPPSMPYRPESFVFYIFFLFQFPPTSSSLDVNDKLFHDSISESINGILRV